MEEFVELFYKENATYHMPNSPSPLWPTTKTADLGTVFNSTIRGYVQSNVGKYQSSFGPLQIAKQELTLRNTILSKTEK